MIKNILNQLRQNLENRPEPAFEENDWMALQKRLDQHDKKTRSWVLPLPIWWLLPTTLLLSTAFLGFELHHANQKINAMTVQCDTLIRSHVVLETDTVYITKTVYQDRYVYLPSPPSNATALPVTQQQQKAGLLTETPVNQLLTDENAHQKEVLDAVKTSPEVPSLAKVSIAKLANQKLNLLRYPYHKPSPLAISFEAAKPPKKTFEQQVNRIIYQMQPKNFQLGAETGFIYPLSANIQKGSGFSTGIRATTAFSERLRLWGDASYTNLYFTSGIMDEAIGVPTIPAPGDNYSFEHATVTQPSLHYNLGLQYSFGHGRLRPFVGLGVGATSLLPYIIKYEFQDQSGTDDITIDKEVHQSGYISGFIPIQAGFEGRISKRWYWQTVGMYRFSPFKSGLKAPDVLGISGRLMYRF